VRDLVAAVDVAFVNEDEARAMTGCASAEDAADELARRCAHLVVKRGAGGASAHVAGERLDAPGIPVDVVDATGAGDCFAAGYLWGFLGGLPPATCLGLGNLCGAAAVTALGGYQGAPTLARLTEGARDAGLALA
jgi:sugar/nucleoside kinase (ribokinase family)